MAQSLYLEGKKIIVTGAATGIGRAIAVALADLGAWVAAVDLRVPDRTVQALGRNGLGLAADVTNPEQVRQMVTDTVQAFGGVDGLVNNAGIYSSIVPRPFEDISLEDWRELFDVNVFGLMTCCQEVVPHMKRAGGGRIVNIISGTPFRGIPYMLHYVSSKGAVLGMTRSLARELGASGIRVNGVAPGFTLSENVLGNDTQLEKLREVSRSTRSLARDQMPDDVVGAVGFLLSDAADFITGQTLVVDGGAHFN